MADCSRQHGHLSYPVAKFDEPDYERPVRWLCGGCRQAATDDRWRRGRLSRPSVHIFRQYTDEVLVVVEGASLAQASLMGKDLTCANLRGADLRGADLTGSSLRDADLYRADLRRANLRRANLRGTSLVGARLEGADLRDAQWDEQTLWPSRFGPRVAESRSTHGEGGGETARRRCLSALRGLRAVRRYGRVLPTVCLALLLFGLVLVLVLIAVQVHRRGATTGPAGALVEGNPGTPAKPRCHWERERRTEASRGGESLRLTVEGSNEEEIDQSPRSTVLELRTHRTGRCRSREV